MKRAKNAGTAQVVGRSGRTGCSISDDLGKPLDQVSRAWIRRPVTLLLWPLLLVATVLIRPIEESIKWFRDCW